MFSNVRKYAQGYSCAFVIRRVKDVLRQQVVLRASSSQERYSVRILQDRSVPFGPKLESNCYWVGYRIGELYCGSGNKKCSHQWQLNFSR
jgi:hypothetical protein